jgi:hypothetical protein
MAKQPDIQVIVIDPFAKTVDKRWIPNTLDAMQQLVGGSIESVYAAALGGECLYCNENGKWDIDPIHSFTLRTWEHDQLHGTCIILGTYYEGDNASTGWSPEAVANFVTWSDGSKPYDQPDHTREALEQVPGYGSF